MCRFSEGGCATDAREPPGRLNGSAVEELDEEDVSPTVSTLGGVLRSYGLPVGRHRIGGYLDRLHLLLETSPNRHG